MARDASTITLGSIIELTESCLMYAAPVLLWSNPTQESTSLQTTFFSGPLGVEGLDDRVPALQRTTSKTLGSDADYESLQL